MKLVKRMIVYIILLIIGFSLIVIGVKNETNVSVDKEEMAEIVETKMTTEMNKPIRFEWIDIPILDCDIESFDDLVIVVNDVFGLNANEKPPILVDFEIVKVNQDNNVSLIISARIDYCSAAAFCKKFLYADLPVDYNDDNTNILVFKNYNTNFQVREKCLEKLFEQEEVTFESMEFDHPYHLK